MKRNRRPRKNKSGSTDQWREELSDENKNLAEGAGSVLESVQGIVNETSVITIDTINMEEDLPEAVESLHVRTQKMKDYWHKYINLSYIQEFADQELPVTLKGIPITPNNLLKEQFTDSEWLTIVEFQSKIDKPYNREDYVAFLQSIDLFERIPVKLWSVMKALSGSTQIDSTWKSFLEEKTKELHDEYFFILEQNKNLVSDEVKKVFQEKVDEGCTEKGFDELLTKYLNKKWNVYDHTPDENVDPFVKWRIKTVMNILPWTKQQQNYLDILEKDAPDPLWQSFLQSRLADTFQMSNTRKNNQLFQTQVQASIFTLFTAIFNEDLLMTKEDKREIRRTVTDLFSKLSETNEILDEKKLKTLIYLLVEKQSHKTRLFPSHAEFYDNMHAIKEVLKTKSRFYKLINLGAYGISSDADRKEIDKVDMQAKEILSLFFGIETEIGKGKNLDYGIMKSLPKVKVEGKTKLSTYSKEQASSSIHSHIRDKLAENEEFHQRLFSWFIDQANVKREELFRGMNIDQPKGTGVEYDEEIFQSVDAYVKKIIELIPYSEIYSGLGDDKIMVYIKLAYEKLSEMLDSFPPEQIKAYLDGSKTIGSTGLTLSVPRKDSEPFHPKEEFIILLKEYIKAELLVQGPDDVMFGESAWPLENHNSTVFINEGDQVMEYSYYDLAMKLKNDKLARYLLGFGKKTEVSYRKKILKRGFGNKVTMKIIVDKYEKSADRSKTTHRLEGDFTEEKLDFLKKNFEHKHGLLVHKSDIQSEDFRESIGSLIGPETILSDKFRLDILEGFKFNQAYIRELSGKSILTHIVNQKNLDAGIMKNYFKYFANLNPNEYQSASEHQLTPIHEAIIAGNIQGLDLSLKEGITKNKYIHLQTRHQVDKNNFAPGILLIHLIAMHNNQDTAREMIWTIMSLLPEQIFLELFPKGAKVLTPATPKSLLILQDSKTGLTGLQTLAEYGHLDLVEELMKQYDLDIWGGQNKKEVMLKIAASKNASVEVLEWFEKKFLEEEYFGKHATRFNVISKERVINGYYPGEDNMSVSGGDHYDDSNPTFTYVCGLESHQTRKERKQGNGGRDTYMLPIFPHDDFIHLIKDYKEYWIMHRGLDFYDENEENIRKELLNNPKCRYSFKLFGDYQYFDAVIMSGNLRKVEYILSKGGFIPERHVRNELMREKENVPEGRDKATRGVNIDNMIRELHGEEKKPIIYKLLQTKMHLPEDVDELDWKDYCDKVIKVLWFADQKNTKSYEEKLDVYSLKYVKEILSK